MRSTASESVGVVLALAALALTVGCEDAARGCTKNGDCFSGEVCIAGGCESAGGDTGGVDSGQDTAGADTAGADTAGADTAGETDPACVVDPLDTTCTNDDLEPSDGPYSASMLVDPQSWCQEDGTLDTTPKTFSATFCAGEPTDLYQLYVYNVPPTQNCIDGPVRLVYTVELAEDCDPDAIEMLPNYFGSETSDGCTDSEMDAIRCEVSQDGRTHTFTFLWTSIQQDYDAYLYIGTPGRNDVQFDYDVTVQVIPQNQ